jgi:hypothetical protein
VLVVPHLVFECSQSAFGYEKNTPATEECVSKDGKCGACVRAFRFDGSVRDELMTHCHRTALCLLPRITVGLLWTLPVPQPVQESPDHEGSSVDRAQKAAWDRVCNDPDGSRQGKAPSERRFGRTKRLHGDSRVEVRVGDAVVPCTAVTSDKKKMVHVRSERRRRSVRIVDTSPFFRGVTDVAIISRKGVQSGCESAP